MLRTAIKENRLPNFILLLLVVIIFLVIWSDMQLPFIEMYDSKLKNLQNVHLIFFSIVLEALPFIILGVLGSTFLEIFVSPDTIRRLLPRTWLLGIPISGLLGFLFPFCECGLVPIVRRLVAKGVPVPMAAVFLLTAPVVNPVVGASTHFAFMGQPEFLYLRLGGAYILAVAVGFLLIQRWRRENPLRQDSSFQDCGCGYDHAQWWDNSLRARVARAIPHSQQEFFTILFFLSVGALLAASAQVYMPREVLTVAGSQEILSVVIMMVMAFILSLCSGADAFVAATFVNTFSPGALVAFMVFGPMVDFKNLMMMLAAFKVSFVVRLVSWVTLFALALGIMINLGVVIK